MVTALGVVQILAWGSSFYFPAVLAGPIVADTGWPLSYVVGGVSIGLLIAGLISPRVGLIIDRHGGRPVLVASSVLYATGLAGIGLSPALPVYLLSWVVLGVGMGAGLYDAAFATLGKLYGHDARGPITNLTLFGGFSSTVCWPLSAYLVTVMDWRGTCLVYAALHLCVSLPLQLAFIPRGAISHGEHGADGAVPLSQATAALRNETLILVLIAAVMTLAAGIGAIVVVHLLIFLQARGVEFATAVAFGTLFGPSQVAARVIERLFGRHYHPIWTMIGSCVLMAIGLFLLLVDLPILALAILLYGGGYGVSWIARGTLPLALFGPQRYATLIGRLAFPSLIVQALAPAAGAFLIERAGSHATLTILAAVAVVNVALIGALWSLCRKRTLGV
ncbi:MAG: MFS transporter [Rhizobiales bacterium]|nr:MFS transporter [Hyphomicrobiales bacterium]